MFLIFLALFPTFVFSHSKQSDIDKVVSLISEDLKEQGIKTIKEIYSKTNKKNVLAVTKHFSKFKLAQSNKLNNDTLYYAVEEDSLSFDIDEVYIYFLTLSKSIKNPKKIIVFERSGPDDAIGMEFSLRIPTKKLPNDQTCSHYIITFRKSNEGKLLIREWYSMPGYSDCL